MLRSLALLLLFPVAALAAEAAPQSWASPLLDELGKLLALLVGALLARALAALRDKLDADRRYVSDELLASVASRAACYAEEYAASLASHGAILAGAEKLSIAAAEVLSRVPGVTQAQAEAAVRAALVWGASGAAAKLADRRGGLAREHAPEGPDGNP
jgi:hypothetical protein